MSTTSQALAAPYWEYTTPPAGLSDEWQQVYSSLANPVGRVLMFVGLHERCRGLPPEKVLLKSWTKALEPEEAALRAVVAALHGRSQRTWEIGTAIRAAISPISGMIQSAAGLYGPERLDAPKTVDSYLWTKLGDLLRAFDPESLWNRLAAAVRADANCLPAPSPSPDLVNSLPDLPRDILRTLNQGGATNREARINSDEIAKRIRNNSPDAIRKAMKPLKDRNLVESCKGAGAGYWLSPSGHDAASKL
jgi:Winged helix-turn-helix transcription repressor, HrcA DNA-binding